MALPWTYPQVKNVADRVMAVALLLVLWPLLLVTGLAVLCILGRPVFFRQQRPGLHGRPFVILKFRTMAPARPGTRANSDEERLGWFGRALRASSLDELPELINIARGEMSFVGPRPLLMEYLPRYSPEQARRHEVKPGLTGLAQINGRNALAWDRRFLFDVWYVDHLSFWLDVKILAITALKVLSREGIAAEGHATMPEFMGSDGPRVSPLPQVPLRAVMRVPFRVARLGAAMSLVIMGWVAVIDPYGVFGLVTIPEINARKTERTDGGGRVEKSLQLWQRDPDTLILGSTRTWLGIDPKDPALRDANAYNAAVIDASLNEVVAIGRFALRHNQPRRMIIGLDFSMFGSARPERRDFAESGFDGDPMPLVLLRSMIQPRAVKDALETVEGNVSGEPALDESNGFRRHPGERSYRLAFRRALARQYLDERAAYRAFRYNPKAVAQLERFLRRASSNGVSVTLFTAPVHARQLEALETVGLGGKLDRWLSDLTRTVAAVNADPRTRHPVALWSFTGYNSVTTEDVPDPGDPRTAMNWYWDSSIYKPALGNLILARLSGHPHLPADFGVPLTPATLPSVLAGRRAGHLRYQRTHPAEVRDLRRQLQTAELHVTPGV